MRASLTFVTLQMLSHFPSGGEALSRQVVALRLHSLRAVGPDNSLHAPTIRGRMFPAQDHAAFLVQADADCGGLDQAALRDLHRNMGLGQQAKRLHWAGLLARTRPDREVEQSRE